MEVAGGFVERTGGGGACACGFVVSGTPCGCSVFFFFEKSGISFFRFITPRCAFVRESCERGDSNPHGLLHWILRLVSRPTKISARRRGRDRSVPKTPS